MRKIAHIAISFLFCFALMTPLVLGLIDVKPGGNISLNILEEQKKGDGEIENDQKPSIFQRTPTAIFSFNDLETSPMVIYLESSISHNLKITLPPPEILI